MRLAVYNVENLFARAKAMNLGTWAEGKQVLVDHARFNTLIQKATYSAADKAGLLSLLEGLGLLEDDESDFVILRQSRGRLVKRPRGASPEIVASGRGDWTGWLELKTEPVDEIALQMTAKVIHECQADVLGVVEAEDRIALREFNDQLVRPLGGKPYRHAMLIDGNDMRGIDVALLTREDYPISSICCHVDDAAADGTRIFSRDCPEYEVRLPSGESLWVLVNHLKSKGYGRPTESNTRRKQQARRVRELYDARRASGARFVAVMGDLNDTPDSDPLSPLFENGSELANRDFFNHPKFQGDGRPGTYGNGTESNKIDYILLSPALWQKVTGGGVLRMGVWGGKNGTLFPHYPEITGPAQAASDHAAIWADIDV
jgi:endonuclease/exonuclease/phosphatase family metal-dependent hydrolase